jgi:hypothetical protein
MRNNASAGWLSTLTNCCSFATYMSCCSSVTYMSLKLFEFHGSSPSSSDMRPKFPSEETGTAIAFRPHVCSTRSRSLSSTNFVSSGASNQADGTASGILRGHRKGTICKRDCQALSYHHARASLFEKLAIIAPTAKDPYAQEILSNRPGTLPWRNHSQQRATGREAKLAKHRASFDVRVEHTQIG